MAHSLNIFIKSRKETETNFQCEVVNGSVFDEDIGDVIEMNSASEFGKMDVCRSTSCSW